PRRYQSLSYADLYPEQSSRHTRPLTRRENKPRSLLRGRTVSTNPPAGHATPLCNKATQSMPKSLSDPSPKICPRNNLPILHRELCLPRAKARRAEALDKAKNASARPPARLRDHARIATARCVRNPLPARRPRNSVLW